MLEEPSELVSIKSNYNARKELVKLKKLRLQIFVLPLIFAALPEYVMKALKIADHNTSNSKLQSSMKIRKSGLDHGFILLPLRRFPTSRGFFIRPSGRRLDRV